MPSQVSEKKRQGHRYSEEGKATFRRLQHRLASAEQVAAEMGVGSSTAVRRAREAGLSIRRRGERACRAGRHAQDLLSRGGGHRVPSGISLYLQMSAEAEQLHQSIPREKLEAHPGTLAGIAMDGEIEFDVAFDLSSHVARSFVPITRCTMRNTRAPAGYPAWRTRRRAWSRR